MLFFYTTTTIGGKERIFIKWLIILLLQNLWGNTILGLKGLADERTQGCSDLRFSCVFAYVFPYVKVLRFLYVEITLRFSFIKLYGWQEHHLVTKKRNFHKCNYFQSKGLLILENCHCFKVRKHDKIKFEKK